MICGIKLKCLAAGLGLAVLSGVACAEDGALNLSLPPSAPYAKDLQSFMLASNDTGSNTAKSNIAPAKVNPDFKEPWISGNKVHEYFGLATLLSVVATSLTAPGGCESNCTSQQQNS